MGDVPSNKVSQWRWCLHPWTLDYVRAVLRGASDPHSSLHPLASTPDLLELILISASHTNIKALVSGGICVRVSIPSWKNVFQLKIEQQHLFETPSCFFQLCSTEGQVIADSAILSDVGDDLELEAVYDDAVPCLNCPREACSYSKSQMPKQWRYSSVYCVVCGMDDLQSQDAGYLFCDSCQIGRCKQCNAAGSDLSCLLGALYFGHLELLRIMLTEGGCSVDSCDLVGKTLLAKSAELGHATTCEFLLSQGARLDIRDSLNNTPLVWAAFGGSIAACELLIAAGADVNETRKPDDATPICFAAVNGHSETFAYLVRQGARYDPADLPGWCAADVRRISVSLAARTDASHSCSLQ